MKFLLSIFILATFVTSQPLTSVSWNHHETNSFEVNSLNKADMDYMLGSVDFMKNWIYDRWGLKQADFSVKCKIFVTTDKEMHKHLFKKETPMVRIDRDASGKISSMTIWCWTDSKWHVSVLPMLVTEACLAEFEQFHKIKLPLWTHKGMIALNNNIPGIRQEIGLLKDIYVKNLPCFWTEDIMTMDDERLSTYKPENRQLFDRQCAIFCLYLIKTHGVKVFLDFVDAKTPQEKLPGIQ
jgi:hypothetical protein